MEASGQAQWFERLLEGLRWELWRGDAAVIRAKRGRKQKTDREDARHILKLLALVKKVVLEGFMPLPRNGIETWH